jgi:hypothetical protein
MTGLRTDRNIQEARGEFGGVVLSDECRHPFLRISQRARWSEDSRDNFTGSRPAANVRLVDDLKSPAAATAWRVTVRPDERMIVDFNFEFAHWFNA